MANFNPYQVVQMLRAHVYGKPEPLKPVALKPCPFCGDEPELIASNVFRHPENKECWLSARYLTPEYWNRRTLRCGN